MPQTDGAGHVVPDGRDRGRGTGGTGVLACSPDDFKDAAEGFARIREELSAVVSRLAGVLKGCGGMAGSDTGAQKWARDYDPACGGRDPEYGAFETATDVINGAGMMRDLLAYTGANHASADDPNAPLVPPGSSPLFKCPAIPKALGEGSKDEPAWWSLIVSYAEGVFWPNGHQDKLKEAAAAYKEAAAGARCAKGHLPAVAGMVGQQQVPEAPTILAWCDRVSGMVDALAAQFDTLGRACEDQARNIDEAHHKIIEAGVDLAWQTVLIQVGGALLGAFSFGAGEAGAQAVEASRVAAIADRILQICRGFAVAAEATGLPLVESIGALARVAIDVRPLLAARLALYGGEVAAEAETAEELGDLDKIVKLRRPYKRVGTRAQIDAEAEKNAAEINGEGYYRSATDRNVYCPKDKTWEGKTAPNEHGESVKVTDLDKTRDGKYYVDGQGRKYPVDPVWHYGHEPGFEEWRLEDKAGRGINPETDKPWLDPKTGQQRPMTQQEFNDLQNRNPKWFRIEDAPGNESHRYEMPREGQ